MDQSVATANLKEQINNALASHLQSLKNKRLEVWLENEKVFVMSKDLFFHRFRVVIELQGEDIGKIFLRYLFLHPQATWIMNNGEMASFNHEEVTLYDTDFPEGKSDWSQLPEDIRQEMLDALVSIFS